MFPPADDPDADPAGVFREDDRPVCPRCGSPRTLRHVTGLPLPGAAEAAPSWVRWEGCCDIGPALECTDCGYAWGEDEHGAARMEEGPGEGFEEPEDGDGIAPPPPLRVVGAVIARDGRILAARRRPGIREGGRWEFPGGKIEPGETPQQALVRELREELGVEVEVGWLIARGVGVAGDRELHLDCYWARLRGEPPQGSTDHDRLLWLAPDQLADRDWAGPDRPVLAHLLAGASPRFTAG